MKLKLEIFEKLPDVIEFQGQQMKLCKRSKNVALLVKMEENDTIDYVVGRIFRTYVELPNGEIREAKEQFLIEDWDGHRIAWEFKEFTAAKKEFRRLAKNHR